MRAGQELFEGSWREPQEPLLHQVTSSRPAFSNLFSEAGQRSTEGLCPQASILMPPLRKPSPAPPKASRLTAQHSGLAPQAPIIQQEGPSGCCQLPLAPPLPPQFHTFLSLDPFAPHPDFSPGPHQLSVGPSVAVCFEPHSPISHACSPSSFLPWPRKMFTKCLASSRPRLHSSSARILDLCTSGSCDYVTKSMSSCCP